MKNRTSEIINIKNKTPKINNITTELNTRTKTRINGNTKARIILNGKLTIFFPLILKLLIFRNITNANTTNTASIIVQIIFISNPQGLINFL